ncbi:hypothetical protein ACFOU2_07485 [Bacillus songklensis]|uniref:Uncharacterized protein n=1 Tax=Bacillus songklensis TaxID=1069116 RepID=A0ABV8B2E4_9BACI
MFKLKRTIRKSPDFKGFFMRLAQKYIILLNQPFLLIGKYKLHTGIVQLVSSLSEPLLRFSYMQIVW